MARVGLSSNRKFLRLSRALGSRVLARGLLEVLWEPCYECGDPYVGTSGDIEALCEWKGARGTLTAALMDAGAPKGAGFIEPYEGDVRDASEPHYQIHDFLHHCPEYARTRREREHERTEPKTCEACGLAYFARSPRARFCSSRCRGLGFRTVRTVSERSTNVSQTFANGSQTLTNGTPTPVRTLANDRTCTSTEKSTGTLASSSAPKNLGAEPVADDVAGLDVEEGDEARPHHRLLERGERVPPPDTSPVLLLFPVVGKGGPTWPLRESQITRWKALYPDLDVLGEARQALAWIEADPTRRKTAGGMTKCLVAWFNRSVDAPRSRGPTLITGSLKTAGNRAALEEFVRRQSRVD